MTSDEYIALKGNVLDALRELLTATEPGTGLYLHLFYAKFKAEIDQQTTASDASAPQTSSGDTFDHDAWNAQTRAWSRTTPVERERMVLDVLGHRKLSASGVDDEIAARFECRAGQETTRILLRGMLAKGEVERERSTFGRSRYLWTRCSKLSGPIVDLDRQFGGGEATS